MKTIAIDCRMIRHSGIGTYLQRLLPPVLDGMAGTQFVLAGDPALLQGLARGRAYVRIEDYRLPIYSLKHHTALRRSLGADVDLLWTPHFNAPARFSAPQVATIHDVLHLARPEFFGSRLRRWVAWAWYRSTVRTASQIIAISEFTATEIARFFPSAGSKIATIPNFVERNYAEYTPAPSGIERPYILVVGNIKPHKNVGLLLRAFDLVRNDMNLDLVVVGQSDGFLTGDPEVAAALSKGGDRVHFPGFVETDRLKSLYAGAVCTVFPSHYEGFGLGPLESMTLGSPVLASDIPAAREVCGDAALYFDPNSLDGLASAIRSAVADPDLLDGLRRRGLERAKLFRAEDSIAKVIDLLTRLVN